MFSESLLISNHVFNSFKLVLALILDYLHQYQIKMVSSAYNLTFASGTALQLSLI